MNKKERVKILDAAIRKWGAQSQCDMAVEEMAECVVALQKLFKRDNSEQNFLNLASEFADVKIMMEQMERILDHASNSLLSDRIFTEVVEEQIEFKLNRLKGRVESP